MIVSDPSGFKARYLSLDLETHLIQDGLLTPPLVCASFCNEQPESGLLRTMPKAHSTLRSMLKLAIGNGWLLTGANIAYDFGVIAHELPETLPTIFELYERGLVHDVQIAEALHGIAEGTLFKDPRTGGELRDPTTNKPSRYSLNVCANLVLERTTAKENDRFRLRYALLDGIPIEQWPEDARQYPIDDVRNTLDVAIAQIAEHVTQGTSPYCIVCRESVLEQQHCGREPRRNLHDMLRQARAAWALHLGAIWGLRTDAEEIARVEARVEKLHAEDQAEFIGTFLRLDGVKDTKAIKRAVVAAYGATGICESCEGRGQVLSEKQPKRETTPRDFRSCELCDGTGYDLNTATGLVRTDSGAVSTDRDTLDESGDDQLEAFAQVSLNEKLRATYLPFVRQGVDRPINLRPNVLVETGRTSYDGPIQLLPRKGGIRECFRARDGYFYFSIDYEGVELCTLAQCTYEMTGASVMRDVINSGRDLHSALAARMTGADYDAFRAKVKAEDKQAIEYRQVAKKANFGLPGGMGVAKLVQTVRKDGMRFCVSLGTAPKCPCGGDPKCRKCRGRGAICGTEKVLVYNKREITPTCAECLRLGADIRQQWFAQWSEMKEYFALVSHIVDTDGYVTQFGSNRIRGGVTFTSAANGYFQARAADGGKHGLWLVSKECYTATESPAFGARPVIFVHDELFGEVPIANASAACDRMTELFLQGLKEFVPDVRVNAEPALMRRWYKGAKTVRDAAGILQPWEPA